MTGASGNCPFDTRLYRTPYFVIPKLALQAMPMEWRERFEALLVEMEDAGIETPAYHVFRANPHYGMRGCKQVNADRHDQRPFYRLTGGWEDDPWANYRHGDAFGLSSKATEE